MDREIVIVTKDGFKFTYRGEEVKEIENKISSTEDGLVSFGDCNLVIPMENLSYYWCH